jgi:hypothetical protein
MLSLLSLATEPVKIRIDDAARCAVFFADIAKSLKVAVGW